MKYILNDESGIADSETFSTVARFVNKGRIFCSRNKIKADAAQKMKAISLVSKKYQVSDLDFLRFFRNIQDLTVRSERLSNIRSVAQVKELQTLFLENASIDTLLPIISCQHLTIVTFVNVRIGDNDFSPLKQLPELTTLVLQNCGVTDIEWLSGHPKLKNLELYENKINDYSHVKTIPALKYVGTNWRVFASPFDELLSSNNNDFL